MLGGKQNIRFCVSAERKTHNIELHEKSTQERGAILRNIQRGIQLDSLTTVFELLRQEPSALQSRSRGYIYKPPPPAAQEKNSIEWYSGKVLPDGYKNSRVVPITREGRAGPSLATFFEDGLGEYGFAFEQAKKPTKFVFRLFQAAVRR
jgi:hypothetical protein